MKSVSPLAYTNMKKTCQPILCPLEKDHGQSYPSSFFFFLSVVFAASSPGEKCKCLASNSLSPLGKQTCMQTRNNVHVHVRKSFQNVLSTNQGGVSSNAFMLFLINSKDEKKIAFTAHERPMDTPKPRYMSRLSHSIFGRGSTFWPFEYRSEFF